jgi:hypothetical protein
MTDANEKEDGLKSPPPLPLPPPQTTFLNNDVLGAIVEHVKPKYRQKLRLVSRQFNGVIKAQARKNPRRVVIRRAATEEPDASINYVLASLLPVTRKEQWVAELDLRLVRSPSHSRIDARLATNMQSIRALKLNNQTFIADPLLRQLTNLTKLRIDYCMKVSADSLSRLTGLTTLSVKCNNNIDSETLSELTNIRNLDVTACFNANGAFLNAMPDIERLIIPAVDVADHNFSSSLTSLTELDVSNNLVFTGQTLYLLPRLRILIATSCHELRGDAIAPLTALEKLDVSACRYMESQTLELLTRLTKLEAQWCPNFNNATFRSLTLLTKMNVRGVSSVSDALFTETHFPHLRFLDISECPLVTDACIPCISHVENVLAHGTSISRDRLGYLEMGLIYEQYMKEAAAAAAEEEEEEEEDKK